MKVKNMMAVKNGTDYLGHLAWYTISEVSIEREDLKNKLINHKFSRFLPRKISPSDAFRRATKEVEDTRVQDLIDPDMFYNYLIREVYSDKDEIIRHIVVEKVDKKGKKLNYTPDTAKIRYNKKEDLIEYETDSEKAKGLVEEAMSLFEEFKKTYNSRHIREMISNILSTLSPVPVRPSGGVYFVPKAHEEELTNLISLINKLENSESYKIPLVDTTENKDMIRKKINDHVLNAVKDISSLLKSGKLTKSIAKTKLETTKKIVVDFQEYKKVLSESLDWIEGNVDLLQKQSIQMLERLN